MSLFDLVAVRASGLRDDVTQPFIADDAPDITVPAVSDDDPGVSDDASG
jgi:hypothetical protein